ncbi:uncharacterized protein LOC127245683 [Andrographis paniculata]|uniref:uncharacterized protein LOC127245683 n=1 Tax=Andrographis paniculata TaxID=175694 RepID=UPI0021E807D8|nr:uncharacterized protein LOC127245683 [Andrographis paniculata]
MIVIDSSLWTMVPVHDCISSLVYCMRSENIASIMCNGRWIMIDKKITTVDEEEIVGMARKASGHLLKRAAIQIPTKMNFL